MDKTQDFPKLRRKAMRAAIFMAALGVLLTVVIVTQVADAGLPVLSAGTAVFLLFTAVPAFIVSVRFWLGYKALTPTSDKI